MSTATTPPAGRVAFSGRFLRPRAELEERARRAGYVVDPVPGPGTAVLVAHDVVRDVVEEGVPLALVAAVGRLLDEDAFLALLERGADTPDGPTP